MTITKDAILDALRIVPGLEGDINIVDAGMVSEILLKDGRVSFALTVPSHLASQLEPLRRAAEEVVSDLPGVEAATVVLTAESRGGNGAAPPPNLRGAAGHGGAPAQADEVTGIQGVKHIVAVASGKGGVGKSTTAVNLALGLQALGLKVGVFDADIYGPSQPRLLGLSGQMPHATADEKKLIPLRAYGLAVMSMGFLIEEDMPVIWRGPMVVQALQQMLFDVAWDDQGPLDVLIIDMPPGTGDVQLTLAQQVPLAGAVIVSTPQDLALIDARKGLNMFRKVDVPVLGLVENMSYFIAPDTGARYDIFGHGGAEREAEKLGLTFLGGVPLHMDIRELSDAGTPVTAIRPEGAEAAVYRELAARVWGEVEASKGMEAPVLKLSAERDTLRISFKDGYSYDLPAEMLRVMSPSAEVQGHTPAEAKLVSGKRNVRIKDMKPVGKYATKIVFDDGHSTGLYPWSYLADLGLNKDRLWADYESSLSARKLSRDPV